MESGETENLEFKSAKIDFNQTKLNRYCVALANEGGGYLILGVDDSNPRKGTFVMNTVSTSTKAYSVPSQACCDTRTGKASAISASDNRTDSLSGFVSSFFVLNE